MPVAGDDGAEESAAERPFLDVLALELERGSQLTGELAALLLPLDCSAERGM